jgi:hypothetical protein
MSLELLDLIPRPYGPYRGARVGAMAAAVERVMLEKMMSVGLTAQARMMCNGPGRAAEGWSSAEEGAYKAARALNMLTLATQRLVKTYASDIRFTEEREFGESRPEPRIETLAEQAIYSTDPKAAQKLHDKRDGMDERSARMTALLQRIRERDRAYLEATVARLRELDPSWLTPAQYSEAMDAADAAALAAAETKNEPPPPREPDDDPDPDRVRRQPELDAAAARWKEATAWKAPVPKSEKRVVVEGAPSDPKSGGELAPSAPPAPETAKPPGPKGRGAQAGNVLALKAGRHTGAAKAGRAEDSAMLREVRAICADAHELAAELGAMAPAPS